MNEDAGQKKQFRAMISLSMVFNGSDGVISTFTCSTEFGSPLQVTTPS